MDMVLAVDFLHFFVHLFRITGIGCLDFLNFRLNLHHLTAALHLGSIQWKNDQPDDDREQNDGQTVVSQKIVEKFKDIAEWDRY